MLLRYNDNKRYVPIDRAELCALPLPDRLPTQGRRWSPVRHSDLLESTLAALEDRGVSDPKLQILVSPDHRNMVAQLDIGDCGLLDSFERAGLRQSFGLVVVNDNCSKLSLRILGGTRVWVCSNGMLSGDPICARKHTTGLHPYYYVGRLVTRYFDSLANHARIQTRLFETHMDQADAEHYFMELGATKTIPGAHLVRAMGLYRSPPYAEFRRFNAWCTYQAVNEALKRAPLERQAEYLRTSFRVLTDVCGLN